MNVAVLIPANNEAAAIGNLVTAVKRLGHNVIVVDDGSTDKTGETARSQGAEVLTNHPRRGKGATLQRGFNHVVSKGYDGVVTMDGDGQHAPENIGSFLDKARSLPDAVIVGNRMGDSKGMPLVRKLTNMFMSWVISLICRQSIPDTQCGFRYIGTKVLKDIQLSCHDFEVETEVLVKASKKGFKIHSVPIQTIYGDEKSKINPVRDTVRFIRYICRELVKG